VLLCERRDLHPTPVGVAACGPSSHFGTRDRARQHRRAAEEAVHPDASGDQGVEVGDDLEALTGLRVECRQLACEFLHDALLCAGRPV
jgi:hypothetical protein